MFTKIRAAAVAVAVLAGFLPAATAHAAEPAWSWLRMPAEYRLGVAEAINDRGQIAGFIAFDVPAGVQVRPVVWDHADAAPRYLEAPAENVWPEVAAINENGVVAGTVSSRAVIWSADGRMRTLSSADSKANDINDKGEVAGQLNGSVPVVFDSVGGGHRTIPGVPRGNARSIADDARSTVAGSVPDSRYMFVFPGPVLTGTAAQLGTPDGYSYAKGIARNGRTVLGELSATPGRNVLWRLTVTPELPFPRWTSRTLPDPALVVGGVTHRPYSVDVAGLDPGGAVVVGYAWFDSDLIDQSRAYRYRNGRYEWLDGHRGQPHAVNVHGDAVGGATHPNGGWPPIIWR